MRVSERLSSWPFLALAAIWSAAAAAQPDPPTATVPPQSPEPPRVVRAPAPDAPQVISVPLANRPGIGPERWARPLPPAERCPLPAPSAGATVIALGLDGGNSISSVALGSQDDQTTVVDAIIEPGPRPVYLVLPAFRRVIVNLSGAVSRLEHVAVISPEKVPAGVAGLDRGRVSFHTKADCGIASDFYYNPDRYLPHIETLLGRPASVIGGGSDLVRVRISDRDLVGRRGDTGHGGFSVRDVLRRLVPGGVKRLDPAAVVASAPVEAYAVLPSMAGLIQLIQQGKLLEGTRADVEAWAAAAEAQGVAPTVVDKVRAASRTAPIVKARQPFRFPAGLCGALRAVIILPDGMAAPAGAPCHAVVVRTGGQTG